MHTNIVLVQIFQAQTVLSAYVPEQYYMKCSQSEANRIAGAVSGGISSLDVEFVALQRVLIDKVENRQVVNTTSKPISLPELLLNGVNGGARLSHIISFVLGLSGEVKESLVYTAGEVYAERKPLL